MDTEITARLNASLTNIYNDWSKVVKQLADEGEPRAQALLAPTTSLDLDLVYGISIEPDTVIVLHSNEPLNPEQASQLKTQMQDLYPDNTVIVTTDDLRVSTREGR